MDTTASISLGVPGRRRRRHSQQFKDEVIGACRQPGVSMASVALANGLNANLVRAWIAKAGRDRVRSASGNAPGAGGQAQTAGSFVPVRLEQSSAQPIIRIELNRKGTAVTVTWPADAVVECAVWLREVLK